MNLFAAQLQPGNLSGEVHAALKRHSLAPSDLELELTENIALQHDDRSLAPLSELVEAGVGVALDDFGTGYASLSTLKRFPLTRLKVDRSFVSDICVNPHSAAVVESLVTLSKRLGIDIIAEGIETHGQRDHLLALGCDQGQGHMFAAARSGSFSPAGQLGANLRRTA